MNTGEFNQRVDDTLSAIEDALDTCDADIDWDFAGGILTIECDNGSQVIINRQAPTQQIWLAARSGGYHFSYIAEQDCWKQDELELMALLGQALSEQSGEKVSFV
jgi:iron-sulfur cluster assembly protein CyaY